MGFKFLGKIGDREVIVMIGTAATHNFISSKVVVELQIPMERTRGYRLGFGVVGSDVEGAEVWNNVVIKMHGVEISQRFFPANIGIADVVLGCEWLSCVGSYTMGRAPTMHGVPTMAMTLKWLGKTVTLLSDPSLTKGYEIGVITLQWDDDDHDDELGSGVGDDELGEDDNDFDEELCNKKEKEE